MEIVATTSLPAGDRRTPTLERCTLVPIVVVLGVVIGVIVLVVHVVVVVIPVVHPRKLLLKFG